MYVKCHPNVHFIAILACVWMLIALHVITSIYLRITCKYMNIHCFAMQADTGMHNIAIVKTYIIGPFW